MQYFIRINQINIIVTEEVYRVYCRGQRKERYFRKSDLRNQTFYYSAFDTEELNGCELFSDPAAPPPEELVVKQLDYDKLTDALKELKEDELDMIRRIYYYDQSLRQAAIETGIAPTTFHYRHRRVLKKLRERMEQ